MEILAWKVFKLSGLGVMMIWNIYETVEWKGDDVRLKWYVGRRKIRDSSEVSDIGDLFHSNINNQWRLDEIFNLFKSKFCHLQYECNRINILRYSWELGEIVCVKHLREYLGYSKDSINAV